MKPAHRTEFLTVPFASIRPSHVTLALLAAAFLAAFIVVGLLWYRG